MNPKINIGLHFAVPIGQINHPQPEPLNQQLKELFLRWEQDGTYVTEQGVPTNQVNIFESEWQLLDRPEPEIQALRKFVMHGLLMTVANLNGLKREEAIRLQPNLHSWVHVTGYGGYISQHNHPNASWSGIYFVDPGTKPEGFPDSGRVKFMTPNPAIKMHRDAGNASLQGPCEQNTMVIEPKAGKLVLFPSYLMHEVSPFMGDDRRITVAFNCWFD